MEPYRQHGRANAFSQLVACWSGRVVGLGKKAVQEPT